MGWPAMRADHLLSIGAGQRPFCGSKTPFKGTLFTVQTALPLLGKGASVILTGSTAASGGAEAFSVYAALFADGGERQI